MAGSVVANGLAHENKRYVTSVTIVEPKDYFEATNGMIEAIHSPDYEKQLFTFAIPKDKAWHKRVIHIKARVVGIEDKRLTLSNGETIEFDILCLAVGSRPAQNGIWRPQSGISTRRERLKEIEAYRERILKAKTAILVGGGVVGVELTSELAERFPETTFHFLVAEKRVLMQFPWIVQISALRHLRSLRNVRLHMNLGKVSPPSGNKWIIEGGEVEPDEVFWCFANGVNTEFVPAEWLDEHKQIKVNDRLQVKGQINVFAIGDANNITLDKSAKAAIQQAYIALDNIKSLCHNHTTLSRRFESPKRGLIVKLGPFRAILYHNRLMGYYGLTFSGARLITILRWVVFWKLLRECTNSCSLIVPFPVFELRPSELEADAALGLPVKPDDVST